MKETFYFTHDFTAFQDPKIQEMVMNHGMEGYGIYWAIVEMLAQETERWYLPKDYKRISFVLRVNIQDVQEIIEAYGLFDFDEENFWNKRLDRFFDQRAKKSKQAKKNAEKRWGIQSKKKGDRFYVLRCYGNGEQFIKYGITSTSVSRRFSGKLPYDYEIIFEKIVDSNIALEIERTIYVTFANYTPNKEFKGYLECLNIIDKDEILRVANAKALELLGVGNTIKESKVKEKKVNIATESTPKKMAEEFFENTDNQLELAKKISEEKNLEMQDVVSEISNFVSYWQELNASGTKERWRGEKFFDVRRRLATWFGRSNRFKKTEKESVTFNL